MPVLLGTPRGDTVSFLRDRGFPAYRAKQIEAWVYRRGARDYGECANLPSSLISALEEEFPLGAIAPSTAQTSSDGTKKYLFPVGGISSGDAGPVRTAGSTDDVDSIGAVGSTESVEAALIPDGKRLTLCLSTQIGCRRACTFCQTGRQGFNGDLSTAEILNQYHSLPERSSVTNIVYMGMGEPLDNVGAVLESLSVLTDPERYALSPRRITLSTVGILPALKEFLRNSSVNLAVSIHNPFPEERLRIMPVERDHPIGETLELIRSGREDRKRRITFEYTLFEGMNDSERHARRLARLLGGLSTRVNLVAFHRIENSPLRPTSREGIERFAAMVRGFGIRTFIRASRGEDIHAACGMLWTRKASPGS